jgi:hypothetical protein
MSFTRRAALLLVLLAVSTLACASEPPRRPASVDPSNPANGESATALQLTPSATPTAAERSGAAMAYGCPMHPEVQQPGPGRCPKCGMTLAPRLADGGA